MPEWARVTATTIHKFVRGEEVNVLRNRKLTALMKRRGRIKYNESGDLLDWKVRYRRAPLFGFADSDTLTFSRRNRWLTAQLPWRGYATNDQMTKKETLMNKGVEAIVKVYQKLASTLLQEDIEENFADEFYIDGNAAANTKRMHGIESFFGEGTTVDADKITEPSDTYAGLSTALANKGGTWSGDITTPPNANVATDWPAGTGDYHYDYWSPVMLNYGSATWKGTEVFNNNGHEVIRQGIIWGQRNKSKRGQLDMFLLEGTMYNDLLTILDSKERFYARQGRVEGSLAELGFTDSVNVDGVDVTWEYGVPADVGYGFNVDQMQLCSLQGQLFVPGGPVFDEASQSYRFWIDFYGNLKCNPRGFEKLALVA